MKDNKLPKSNILKRKKLFRQLFESGERIHGSIGQLISIPSDNKKVAFVVGKRVGSSVMRNLLKRRMREFYRNHKDLFPENRVIVLQLFQQDTIPDYHSIKSEFLKLCQKL